NPLAMLIAPSITPIGAKAQQLPHLPWDRAGGTNSFQLQATAPGEHAALPTNDSNGSSTGVLPLAAGAPPEPSGPADRSGRIGVGRRHIWCIRLGAPLTPRARMTDAALAFCLTA